ncbi:MAG TPA: hypothetical protein VII94_01155 [Candidatus Saccharimonadales bacterium]
MEPNTKDLNKFSKQPPVITSVESSEWPGAFGIYKISKAAITKNIGAFISAWVTIIVIWLIYSLSLNMNSLKKGGTHYLFGVVYEILAFIISSTVIFMTIESVKNKNTSFGQALTIVFPKTVNIVVVYVLVALLSILSFVLLIIPAFFVVPRIYMAIYFVLDKNMSPTAAIKASWTATDHHIGKVYGIIGVNLLILLPVITIIGILATVYFGIMYYAATAVLYIFITKNKQTKVSDSN